MITLGVIRYNGIWGIRLMILWDILGYNYDVTSSVAPQIVNQVAIVSFYKPTNVVS